ncbi:hypothetical protein CCB80_13640 [Armatimonadetes bacterium Uphvl-Ar1]|nr:hypothetical protein CCB80_13640 [Armatimonadetes bacterium Uphvl-Ar1]
MNNKLNKLGWVAAGALAVTMMFSGFQANGSKMATVDMQRILDESRAGKKVFDDLTNEVNLRQGLLEFLNTNKIVTADQANQLRTLTLKPAATQADKDAAEKLKSDIRAENKKFNDLMVKATLTDAERASFNEMNSRRQNTDNLLQQWSNEFSQDITNMREDKLASVLQKSRAAVTAVGKKEGYTIIFPTTVAVYAANDITDAAIKAVDETP